MNYLSLLDDNQLVTICKYSCKYIAEFDKNQPTYNRIIIYYLKDNVKKSLVYFMYSHFIIDPYKNHHFGTIDVILHFINFGYCVAYYPINKMYGVTLETINYKNLQYYISHSKVSTRWY